MHTQKKINTISYNGLEFVNVNMLFL